MSSRNDTGTRRARRGRQPTRVMSPALEFRDVRIGARQERNTKVRLSLARALVVSVVSRISGQRNLTSKDPQLRKARVPRGLLCQPEIIMELQEANGNGRPPPVAQRADHGCIGRPLMTASSQNPVAGLRRAAWKVPLRNASTIHGLRQMARPPKRSW